MTLLPARLWILYNCQLPFQSLPSLYEDKSYSGVSSLHKLSLRGKSTVRRLYLTIIRNYNCFDFSRGTYWRVRLVIKNLLNLLHNLRSQFGVDIKSLDVLLDLFWLCPSKRELAQTLTSGGFANIMIIIP